MDNISWSSTISSHIRLSNALISLPLSCFTKKNIGSWIFSSIGDRMNCWVIYYNTIWDVIYCSNCLLLVLLQPKGIKKNANNREQNENEKVNNKNASFCAQNIEWFAVKNSMCNSLNASLPNTYTNARCR